MPKRKNKEPFVMLFREVINSFAWRAASGPCRQWIYRIAEEHMAHGGVMNGQLKVTKTNMIEYGLRNHDKIAPALREAIALGLVIMTERGRGGNAESRRSHQFGLAFLKDQKLKYFGTKWKQFRSLDEAKAAATEARAAKDTWAVEMGRKRRKRSRKIIRFPVLDVRTETGPGCQDRKAANAG
jgi:hypothetical protein